MISAVIIDDQQECIDDLLYLIEKNKLPVNVLATANSGNEGLAAILKHKPELLFLDVVMPGMSGFELLELLPNPDFQLIITTSIDKYAVQAIRSSALDFLIKPIKLAELREAINRSIEKKDLPNKSQINLLRDNLKDRNIPIRKIALTISDGVELVLLDDILFFESDGNYTTVFMKGEKSIVVSKPIGKFEEMIDDSVFFRIHNSYLVNLNHIKKFIRSDGGYVVLENGKTISVSRNRKEAFLKILENI
jgi:two-component system, LytTR family, response regulator